MTAPRCAKFSRSPSAARTSGSSRRTGRPAALAKTDRRARRRACIDTSLGGDDGYALAKEIRVERRPRSPSSSWRAGTTPYDANKGREAGADDYMDKPFDTQQMIDKVKKAIVARESGAGAGAAPAPKPAINAVPTVHRALARLSVRSAEARTRPAPCSCARGRGRGPFAGAHGNAAKPPGIPAGGAARTRFPSRGRRRSRPVAPVLDKTLPVNAPAAPVAAPRPPTGSRPEFPARPAAPAVPSHAAAPPPAPAAVDKAAARRRPRRTPPPAHPPAPRTLPARWRRRSTGSSPASWRARAHRRPGRRRARALPREWSSASCGRSCRSSPRP